MERKGAYYVPTEEEFELFYSGSSRESDCVGHLRLYLDGERFWHQWFDHTYSYDLNTDEFKAEFYPLMDSMMDAEFSSKNSARMLWACSQPLEQMLEYGGVKLMSEHYEYYIRIPAPEYIRGNYTYIYCYKRKDV